VPGLVSHPGIAFVAARSENGRQVIGAGGHTMTPDLYVNSSVDERTLEVAAFELHVGSHGRLGGWQARAILLIPATLRPESSRIHRADEPHCVFVAMLRWWATGSDWTTPCQASLSRIPLSSARSSGCSSN
jgi:hypothetical protein